MCCYVYFIKANDCVKIGHADNVNERLKGIQTGNPFKCEVIRKIRCTDKQMAIMLEDYLHDKYYEYRTEAENEWFQIIVFDDLRTKTDDQLKKEADVLPRNIVLSHLKANKKEKCVTGQNQFLVANNASKKIKMKSFYETVHILHKGLLNEFDEDDLIEKYIRNYRLIDTKQSVDYCYEYPNNHRYAYQTNQCHESVRLLCKYLSKKITISELSFGLVEYSVKQIIDTFFNYMWNNNCRSITDYYNHFSKKNIDIDEYLNTGGYLLTDGIYNYISNIKNEVMDDGGYLTCSIMCKRVSDFCFLTYNTDIAKISDIDEFLSVLLRILKEQIKPMVSVDIDGVNTWFLPGGSICEK